jgi:hypothetical protein
MSKQKLSLTKVKKQNSKWLAKHNDSRRRKYNEDPEYRRVINERNFAAYRVRTGGGKPKPMLENLKRMAKIGRMRDVSLDGVKQRILTVNVNELSEIIVTHCVVVYRWFCNGICPRPNVMRWGALEGQPGGYVYSARQVEKLVEALDEHQQHCMKIRQDHTKLIARLFAAVGESAPQPKLKDDKEKQKTTRTNTAHVNSDDNSRKKTPGRSRR